MIPTFPPNFESRKLIYALDMPSFQRDFASLKTLDHGTGPSITFTRNSNATYFDANGVLQTASNNTPRFDHDPANGNSLGLLVEGSRTNLHLYSQDFSQGWANNANTNLAVDATETGLDGTLSVGAFTCSNTDAASRRLFADANITTASGTNYTFSVYLKSINSWPMVLLHCSGGTTVTNQQGNAHFDLINGTVAATGVGSATIQNVGNGWYRCEVTTSGNTVTGMRPKIILVSTTAQNASASVTGIIDAGVYVWGAQLEPSSVNGSFATSYIPTTNASVRRSSDSVTVSPVSSFFNTEEGTLFVEAEAQSATGNILFTLADFSNNTSNEEILLNRVNNLQSAALILRTAGSDAGTVSQSVSASAGLKVAAIYKSSDLAISANAGTAATSGSATLPTGITQLQIGRRVGSFSGRHLQSRIRKIAYWPKRLSNTLLEQLTT
jgi:hypothetical protein